MAELVPQLQAVGTVYNNAEANSQKVSSVARELFRRKGLRLEEATVAGSSEVLQAAQVVAQKNVNVLWEFGDNTVTQGLEGMTKAANDAGLPLVTSDVESANRGAMFAVGVSFYESGYAAGDLVARVLSGEKPADIPFVELAVARRAANLGVATQAAPRDPDEPAEAVRFVFRRARAIWPSRPSGFRAACRGANARCRCGRSCGWAHCGPTESRRRL